MTFQLLKGFDFVYVPCFWYDRGEVPEESRVNTMFDEKIKHKLFLYVDGEPSQYSKEGLGSLLSVSAQTIREEVKEINDHSETNGFSILNKQAEGYFVDVIDEAKYNTYKKETLDMNLSDDIFNAEDREEQFIRLLLRKKRFTPLENIAEEMNVSQTILTNGLSGVRKLLQHYNLEFVSKAGRGIQIEGTEKDKRYLLLSYLEEGVKERQMSDFFDWLDPEFSFENFNNDIYLLLSRHRYDVTDENLINFTCRILIIADRIRYGYTITDVRPDPTAKEYADLMSSIEALIKYTFDLNIPQAEMDYVYILLRSKAVFKENVSYDIVTNAGDYIIALLTAIEENHNYNLFSDKRLKLDLKSHMNSMLYRVENDIRVRNPMEEHIKKYYPLANEITLAAIKSIRKQYKYKVNQGEIAYIALHIGAAMERNYQVKHERHNSCLIVCGTGFGTARMIESTIKKTIPDLFITKTISAEKYHKLDYIEEDIVITTIEIEEKNKPIFKIKTLPSKRELLELDERITNEFSESVNIFDKYFSRDLFVKRHFESKQEAIDELASLLETQGVIDESNVFVESVMSREEMGSTAIGEGVSIPHPLGLIANKTKIAVGIVEHSIEWEEGQPVQLIFMLAVSKEDYEEALGIYDFLVDVIRENHFKKLVESENFDAFIECAREVERG